MSEFVNKWRAHLGGRDLLTERPNYRTVKKTERDETISLPQIRISEKFGDPDSADRQMIGSFMKNIQGKSLTAKINFINRFINNCKDACIRRRSTKTILANLVFLDVLASIVYDFNYAVGGFLFEAFLASLYGKKAEQIPATQKKDTVQGGDIADFLDNKGDPISLKFYKVGGSGYVGGSLRDLRNSIVKYKKPMKYLVVLKDESEGGAVNKIDFYEFTVGTNGKAAGDKKGPLSQMRAGTPESKTDFYAENYLGKTKKKASPRFEIPVGQVKSLNPTATLQFGSQEELKEIANKYANQLQDELVIIFNRLSDLTNNINRYTLDNDQNAGLQASSNASDLYKATRVLVEDKG
jgi:hypothetical protein